MWWKRSAGSARLGTPLQPKPTAEDFTPRAVQRAVLYQTLQHPATILPAAMATVAALWSLAIDLSPTSLLAVLGCGFVSAAAWVINYVGRGEHLAAQHIRMLQQYRDAHERQAVEALIQECRDAGFADGAKEASEITAAYTKLQHFLLTQLAGHGDARGTRFQVLAEETYRYGVAILQKALNLFQALQRVDVQALEQERQTWISQHQQQQTSPSLERNIAAHTQRLERYHRRQEELHALLAQLNELETALETAYLEIVDLVGEASTAVLFESQAVSSLQTAVEAARRVEQRLRALGEEETQNDETYLKAGEQSSD